MAGYIPKEDSQNYPRWRPDDFSSPVPKPLPPLEKARDAENPENAALAGSPPPSPLSTGLFATEDSGTPVEDIPLPTAEDIERIHNTAHQEGYEAGLQEGQAKGHQEGYEAGLAAAKEHTEALAALCQGLREALTELDQEIAENLLACALEVANQVTGTVIRAQPEILLPIIQEALQALPLRHGTVTLRIPPDHAALVKEHLGNLFSQSGWRILEDSGISPGGCRLQVDSSEVDATLPTRWRRVLEAIGVTPEWLDQTP